MEGGAKGAHSRGKVAPANREEGGLYPVLRRGKTRQINPLSTRRETLRPSVIPTTCLEATLFLNQVKISTNQGTSEPKPKLFADMA